MNIKLTSSHKKQEPESGCLYIVGTPIGNLSDISLRAINILQKVSLIACEDTRQTKKILHKYEFTNNLVSFNKHNSLNKTPRIIENLKYGKSVALVSDAGMPIICDPGEDLVCKARSLGVDIICIPGPCAAIAALVTSGMPSSKFIFEGFLPKKQSDRKKILLEISNNEKTTILFESPKRLKRLLKELGKFCGGQREIEVARELTKMFEEHIGNTIDKVVNSFEEKEVMGEITIVIKGINKKNDLETNLFDLKRELNDLVSAGLSLSAASSYLAKKNGLKKSAIYNLN